MKGKLRIKRIGTGAALVTGVLAATSLAFAPSALAVTPQTATINADCGIFGGGAATITATQDGTAATVTVNSAITAPLPLAQDSIASTFTFVNASGGTTVFSGTVNPAMATGDAVTVGPLSGTVASGDSLEAYGGSLQMTIFGIAVTCTPTAAQSPGPFVFD
ncbi:hypothetical protein ACIQPR_30470 [Streptomyces sp. NPDC091280]|uniref:hypothetical protein n=1 Tax=unclassified Streptomyces TaxID=2593676 RepID=UPI0037F66781